MTDTREKLLEHINYFTEHVPHEDGQTWEEAFANHLIANGVTFAKGTDVPGKWIPVTERLPEPFMGVLALIPSESPLPTVHESYIADHEAWVCLLTAERYRPGEVTHWMPMPEPPKEGDYVYSI